ncbi:hypothetical protein KL86DPRO_60239 [uncultured delta proteobacterium]|uniref:Anti-sigma factor NepR domain-containing protein n=1 Tax=uncultured delta proteobacterium TaxID=34034 RepID=A0A212KFY7_9DELT|nr:hypothetical protein KL86DPRO_60239 [uncultured delta proteobacterium]
MTDNKKPEAKDKSKPEILKHMTRAEMVSELMMMLNEVSDEDMPAVHELIRQVMTKKESNK